MKARGHAILGALVGAGVALAAELAACRSDPHRKINGWLVAGGAIVGTGSALIPDVLEPATSPNHRAFCHSVVAGLGVSWALCGQHTLRCTPADRTLLACAAAGYISHLAADAFTPRSIRFV